MTQHNDELPSNDERELLLDQATQLIRDEFGQAWQHYRHLELLRGQYLNFAFTVTFGTVALAIPVASFIAKSVGALLLAGAFIALYAMFIGSLYANVRKLRFLLLHYRRVLDVIRDYYYTRVSDLSFDTRQLNVLTFDHPVIRSRLFRTQSIAESILVVFLLAATATELSLTLGISSIDARWWQSGLMVVMTIWATAISVTVIAFWFKYRHDAHADQGLPQVGS